MFPWQSLLRPRTGLTGLALAGVLVAGNLNRSTSEVDLASRIAAGSPFQATTASAADFRPADPDRRSAEPANAIDPGSPEAATLRALDSLIGAGQIEAAGERAAAVETALGGHPARLVAESLQARGRAAEAVGWYRQALDLGVSRAHQVNVFERLAQCSEVIQDWPAAAIYYREAGKLAKYDAFRAEAGYREAASLNRAGDNAAAIQRWAAVARGYPSTVSANRSLDALGAANRHLVPAAVRGAIYEAQGEFGPAIEAYGKAVQAATDPDEAYEEFYRRALVRQRADDPGAIDDFAYLVNQYPSHNRADDALWHLARAEVSAGQLDTARARYLAIAESYPNSPFADDALVEAGILAWRAKEPETALATWGRVSAHYLEGDNASRALYWLGKTRAQLAGDAAGQNDLRAAARYDDYYGYRARAALVNEWRPGRTSGVSADRWQSPLRTAAREAEAIAWLDRWTEVGGETLDLPADLTDSAAFRRARALQDGGRPGDAALELGDLAAGLRDRPATLLRLGVWLAESGLTSQAMSVGFLLDDLATGAGVQTRPAALERLLYPNPYADQIVQAGSPRGIDPAWFFALVRQESGFNPTIRSYAGARGLAQIMPATGEGIAKALGRPTFNPADLDLPATAIDFGTYYLAGQIKSFNGDVMLATAAYNAGGGAVSRWLTGKGYPDFDLFVESIPYRETRTYVKKLYVNFYRYRAIYGG